MVSELGTRVDPAPGSHHHRRRPRGSRASRWAYYLLNKPQGYVTTGLSTPRRATVVRAAQRARRITCARSRRPDRCWTGQKRAPAERWSAPVCRRAPGLQHRGALFRPTIGELAHALMHPAAASLVLSRQAARRGEPDADPALQRGLSCLPPASSSAEGKPVEDEARCAAGRRQAGTSRCAEHSASLRGPPDRYTGRHTWLEFGAARGARTPDPPHVGGGVACC